MGVYYVELPSYTIGFDRDQNHNMRSKFVKFTFEIATNNRYHNSLCPSSLSDPRNPSPRTIKQFFFNCYCRVTECTEYMPLHMDCEKILCATHNKMETRTHKGSMYSQIICSLPTYLIGRLPLETSFFVWSVLGLILELKPGQLTKLNNNFCISATYQINEMDLQLSVKITPRMKNVMNTLLNYVSNSTCGRIPNQERVFLQIGGQTKHRI